MSRTEQLELAEAEKEIRQALRGELDDEIHPDPTQNQPVAPLDRLLCQNCVWEVHPQMLTTYCLRSLACDRCGRVTDLALTVGGNDGTRRSF